VIDRARVLALALGLTVAAACGHARPDPQRLLATCGPACAADELRVRIAADPRDRDLYTALAAIEDDAGRPGAALAALERAELLGRPLRSGVGGADRARLARLLVARATARVARRSPGADADVARARALGATIPATLAHDAALLAIAGDLRHSDPRRRARGLARLRVVDPVLAGGLDPAGAPTAVEVGARWLAAAGARRAHHELLAGFEVAHGLAGFEAMADPAAALDAWLGAARWWSGPDGRPDLATLERALVAGAGPCWFPAASRGRCDVIRAAGSDAAAGPAWEPALVAAWEQGGVRAADRDEALAWLIVAGRAEARGQLRSWARAVRDHVDLAALSADRTLPAWAAAALATLDDPGAPLPPADALPAGPRALLDHLAARRAPAAAPPAWPALAARLAAGDAPALIPDFVAIGDAFAADGAGAGRRAEQVMGEVVDVADVAARLAHLFALLGDPARARALAQRAFDADPEDPRLAFGLALAIADAGDAPAALQMMLRAAAASGDAATTFYRGARGFAAAGQSRAALTLARQAIELSAPGDEAAPAGLAIALLDELGRGPTARELAPLVALPGAWDLSDARAAVDREVAAAAEPASRPAAIARLAALAAVDDPALARLAQAALRRLHGSPPRASTRGASELR